MIISSPNDKISQVTHWEVKYIVATIELKTHLQFIKDARSVSDKLKAGAVVSDLYCFIAKIPKRPFPLDFGHSKTGKLSASGAKLLTPDQGLCP